MEIRNIILSLGSTGVDPSQKYVEFIILKLILLLINIIFSFTFGIAKEHLERLASFFFSVEYIF